MMYNLANTTQQPITNLQLNASTLMGIFSGTINYWDDPAIKTLNPKLISSLPHKGIVPVIRSDASGDNYIFSEYLSALEPTAWQKFMSAVSFTPAQAGNPATAQWPGQGTDVGQYRVGIFNQVSGSDNASNTVASSQNVGSITYVETAYAILHGMPCAAVQNESGRFVKPSSLADAIALSHDKLLPDLEQDLTGVFHAPEAGAYPISAYSYLITQTTGLNPSIGKVLGQFIQFFACQGQISAGQLGYSPLPINLVAEDFAAISRIPGAAKPPPINAKTCKNPYLTGAATYVGGPQVSTGSSSGANSSGAAVAATPSASSQAATAQVKTVSGAEASAQVLGKSHGGLTPVGNQTLGVALGSQATSLLSNSGMPSGTTLLAVLFLLAVVIPPVIAFELRRRRIAKESMVSQGDQE
jgi:ABC-type phosphate transport system substrate-binding protein